MHKQNISVLIDELYAMAHILSLLFEQIENINTEESEKLKERIENILTTIESGYGDSEESNP